MVQFVKVNQVMCIMCLSQSLYLVFILSSIIVKDQLLLDNPSKIFRLKSDNCASQYKCKWVFKQWQSNAMSKERTVIVYYGTAGHDTGLVDAMSDFGVKDPLRKWL